MNTKQAFIVILTIWMLSASQKIQAQTKWKYTYDLAGNRITRIVTSSVFTRTSTDTHENLFADHDITAVLNGNHDQLKIEYLRSTGYNVMIYDLSGKEILSCRTNSQAQQIDISEIPRGIYILRVEADEMIKSCKFRK